MEIRKKRHNRDEATSTPMGRSLIRSSQHKGVNFALMRVRECSDKENKRLYFLRSFRRSFGQADSLHHIKVMRLCFRSSCLVQSLGAGRNQVVYPALSSQSIARINMSPLRITWGRLHWSLQMFPASQKDMHTLPLRPEWIFVFK